MDKNTIWAFILILAVFWISSELFWKQPVPEAEGVEETVEQAEQVQEPLSDVSGKRQETSEELDMLSELPDSIDIEIREDLILENDHVRIGFSNLGARITSIILKDYSLPESDAPVNLLRENGTILGLRFRDPTGKKLGGDQEVYRWEQPLDNQLEFISQGSFGLVRRVYTLSDEYELSMELEVDSGYEEYGYVLLFDDGIADTERYLKRKKQNYQIIAEADNKVERLTLQKLKKERDITGNISWAAMRSKFFVIGIVKDELSQLYRLSAYSNNDSPAFNLYGKSSRKHLNANYDLYLGPVISENMKAMDESFGAAYYAGNGIFFGQGLIKPVSIAFVWIFEQFHKVIPNWGLCLILFSVLIKVILYPLTHKSFESSTKLQKVQPLMTELREKYKSDPQKLNQEMQRIYRENGVSPLGGCLPMLLQMPIFFALYPVIRYSINLRQAGFLWLKDLSEPDPYLILPILMAVFMFLQQYLMQPKKEALEKMSEQQKAQMQSQRMMMYMMPAIMFFLFKSFPGGLVLYWTVFNIMSMFQQRIIRKKFS